ncbi:MAG TPA: filamentous hemagglutinin, partial [Cyanobacteria bacterium UBA11369]|nr:filamentous hemagglutinin [Cyanobacteria bacterium UBA11369]
GNITLNTDILAALENSDITANAQQDKGGEITINADAIFGSVARTRAEIELLLNTKDADPRQLFTSDITAISQQEGPEFQGTVTVNTPDVDPSSGLIELPIDFVDPTRLIVQGCPANRGNSFTVTGRGGLPPSPNDPLRANNTVSPSWVTRDSSSREAEEQVSRGAGEIIEATGWIVNEKGQVVLIASRPTTTFNGFLLIPSSCPETVEAR